MARTTLILDDRLMQEIRDLAEREKRTLTRQMEIVLQAGIDTLQRNKPQKPFKWIPPRDLGAPLPGIDLDDMARVRAILDEYDGRG